MPFALYSNIVFYFSSALCGGHVYAGFSSSHHRKINYEKSRQKRGELWKFKSDREYKIRERMSGDIVDGTRGGTFQKDLGYFECDIFKWKSKQLDEPNTIFWGRRGTMVRVELKLNC